jgi:hypothetical protein
LPLRGNPLTSEEAARVLALLLQKAVTFVEVYDDADVISRTLDGAEVVHGLGHRFFNALLACLGPLRLENPLQERASLPLAPRAPSGQAAGPGRTSGPGCLGRGYGTARLPS